MATHARLTHASLSDFSGGVLLVAKILEGLTKIAWNWASEVDKDRLS